MEGRGQQPRADQGEARPERGDAEPAVRRQQAQRAEQAEQRQQPVSRAGRGGEEDD
jgi:hypothetical protein